MLPIDAVPEITVGSDRVFTLAAQLTRPSYQVNYVTEGTCKDDGRGAIGGGVFDGGVSTGTGGSAGGPNAGGVNVRFPRRRRPLRRGGAALGDQRGPAAVAGRQRVRRQRRRDARSSRSTSQANKYFVAVKLLSGQSTGAIQPVVLKFAGEVPCVPLKLTAIAAQVDLPVNLYVLGDSRAVPSNYFEITLNQAKIDWFGSGSNYTTMVGEAANEAGGNAFIAEYAGTARVMDASLWPNPLINLPMLQAATTPPAFLQQVHRAEPADLRPDAAAAAPVHPRAAGADRHGDQRIAVLQQQRDVLAAVSSPRSRPSIRW